MRFASCVGRLATPRRTPGHSLVEEIRRAADKETKLISAKAAELAESERAKFVVEYQGKMKAFGAKVTELKSRVEGR